MAEELTKKEIYRRMQEWRNMKKLHAGAIESKRQLREDNKILREKLVEAYRIIELQEKRIQTLELQVEELKVIIFGKRGNDDDDSSFSQKKKDKKPRVQRSKSSYSRKVPNILEVTEVQNLLKQPQSAIINEIK